MKAILTGILIFSFALVSCQENEQKAAENPSIPVLKLDSLIISENEADRFHGTVNFKRKRFSNTEYIDFISRLNPVSLPGEQFYYSNFAYPS